MTCFCPKVIIRLYRIWPDGIWPNRISPYQTRHPPDRTQRPDPL